MTPKSVPTRRRDPDMANYVYKGGRSLKRSNASQTSERTAKNTDSKSTSKK
jgi:hypothetical protein